MTLPARSVCALVLAGRRSVGTPDPVAACAGLPVKALVPINGRPMLARVVATLRGCAQIGEIHISLPDDPAILAQAPWLAAEFADGALARVTPAASPSASVREFVAGRLERQTVLVTTADHPLLTPDMVRVFLDGFIAARAHAGVALTDATRIAAAYPGSRRTRLQFADGSFTGCNLFAFAGTGALGVLAFWRRIEEYRKQPWRLAHALGWGTLVRYASGRLTLAAALERLGRISGSRLHAELLADFHAGIDVDKPEDLHLVTRILEQREQGRA